MAETNAVFMKLPLFWADGAKIWFAHAESQFVIRNITAEITIYYNLLAALQNDVLLLYEECQQMFVDISTPMRILEL